MDCLQSDCSSRLRRSVASHCTPAAVSSRSLHATAAAAGSVAAAASISDPAGGKPVGVAIAVGANTVGPLLTFVVPLHFGYHVLPQPQLRSPKSDVLVVPSMRRATDMKILKRRWRCCRSMASRYEQQPTAYVQILSTRTRHPFLQMPAATAARMCKHVRSGSDQSCGHHGAASCEQVVRRARLYETAPAHVANQPRFLNTAIAARTSLPPDQLLAALKAVEVGPKP